MPMADFAFYKDVYLGELIPEKAFPGMALRAKEYPANFWENFSQEVAGFDFIVCSHDHCVSGADRH